MKNNICGLLIALSVISNIQANDHTKFFENKMHIVYAIGACGSILNGINWLSPTINIIKTRGFNAALKEHFLSRVAWDVFIAGICINAYRNERHKQLLLQRNEQPVGKFEQYQLSMSL